MVVVARPVFFLGIATGITSTTGPFAMMRLPRSTTGLLTGRNTIARRQLDFQFDNFVPLLVGTIPFRNGKQFAQTTPAVKGRRGWNNRRSFWIRISHCTN